MDYWHRVYKRFFCFLFVGFFSLIPKKKNENNETKTLTTTKTMMMTTNVVWCKCKQLTCISFAAVFAVVTCCCSPPRDNWKMSRIICARVIRDKRWTDNRFLEIDTTSAHKLHFVAINLTVSHQQKEHTTTTTVHGYKYMNYLGFVFHWMRKRKSTSEQVWVRKELVSRHFFLIQSNLS